MKIIALLLFLTLNMGLSAHNEHKKTAAIHPRIAKKADLTPTVKIKYCFSLSKKYELKYEIEMPMKKEHLALLGWKNKQSRFDTKAIYQPRFQNLEKIDLTSIVEINKVYNLSKTIQVRSY